MTDELYAGYQPVATIKGPNYTFLYNDGTGLGDVHAGQYQIGLNERDAAAFAGADEPGRQALLKRFVEAHEAVVRARKAKAATR